jgi:hypothetical protein
MTIAKSLQIKKTTFIFYLILIVWCDIGITYYGLSELRRLEPTSWSDAEISMTVNPIIRMYGLETGMIIAGIVNSLIIFLIAIAFPIEFAYGVFTGIFILAVAINLRLIVGL